MVHKPKHRVHSFRGLLGTGGQDEINLERQNVNLAYRIVKFDIFPQSPGTLEYEGIAKIYREEQTSFVGTVDFTETDLLGIAYYSSTNAKATSPLITIFDNTLFSRNIYVSQVANTGSGSINYYIEIEEVPVNAATLMQLKLAVARKLNLSESAPDA